jgi:arginyl-tRNA synthetase
VILPVHQLVRSRVAETVGRLYAVRPDEPAIAEMSLEMPPNRALGDIAVPVAFALARRLRKAPRAIAQELAGALGAIAGVTRSLIYKSDSADE